ncbi:hypothetical protein AAH991_38045 [Microbispora sp. ZYX-F-249]|uniref:Immunity protein 63 domain-containing protein n=1 Tax=Microbispora maris TaxID=3144104 RepID=A0ABV0B0D0_9ACTN
MVDLVDMVRAMSEVRFPQARGDILSALSALASPEYQQRVWIERDYPREGYYDDFTLNINILYDDTCVLEDPEKAVGIYLKDRIEAAVLADLARALDALFAALGTERSDLEYMQSPLWRRVVESAKSAYRTLCAGNA